MAYSYDADLKSNYFYVNPLRTLLQLPDSYKTGIANLRKHFPGVFPHSIKRYYEPFLGDGSMFFNMSCPEKYVNDYSLELIGFYEMVRDRNKEFFNYLNALSDTWEFLESMNDYYTVQCYNDGDDVRLANRFVPHHQVLEDISFTDHRLELYIRGLQLTMVSRARRFRRAEYEDGEMDDYARLEYLESAHKAGLYEHVRAVYNDIKELNALKIACWYFLRRYCYNGMFRKNKDGHFTTPFGGVEMNRLLPDIEIEYWTNTDLTFHLKQSEFESMDFLDFLVENNPDSNDFIFIDPPQTQRGTAFTESSFTYEDHSRLADWLMTHCHCQWMLLIKPDRKIENMYKMYGRKSNPLYFGDGFKFRSFHRGEDTKFVMIKNY